MKYSGTLIAVRDIDRSRRFYHGLLGFDVAADFGADVLLQGGIYLQTIDSFKTLTGKEEVALPNNACELYFEEEDIDVFCERLKVHDVKLVHGLKEHFRGTACPLFLRP